MHGATEVATIAASLVGVLAAIIAAVRWLARISRKLDRTFEYVQNEMSLNGGTTLRDAVERLEQAGHERGNMMRDLHARYEELHRSQDAHATAVEHQLRELFVRITRLEKQGTPGPYRDPKDSGEIPRTDG